MSPDDVLDLAVLDAYDHQEKGRRPGRTIRGSVRTGHNSLLWMIRYEMGQLADGDIEAPRTKLQAVARRFVDIMLFGKEDVALRAMQVCLAYDEGDPKRVIQFDIVQTAKSIAEKHGHDPQTLVERAERIVAELGMGS